MTVQNDSVALGYTRPLPASIPDEPCEPVPTEPAIVVWGSDAIVARARLVCSWRCWISWECEVPPSTVTVFAASSTARMACMCRISLIATPPSGTGSQIE